MPGMERIEVELFSPPGSNAIVRMLGRRFPGVLIQGDSLSNLRHELARIAEACTRGDLDEAREWSESVLDHLDVLLEGYSSALRAHQIPLPFPQPDVR